jgi:hypothetical protein
MNFSCIVFLYLRLKKFLVDHLYRYRLLPLFYQSLFAYAYMFLYILLPC